MNSKEPGNKPDQDCKHEKRKVTGVSAEEGDNNENESWPEEREEQQNPPQSWNKHNKLNGWLGWELIY